ncbi:hypothetical protein EMCRGX_G003970 [Ephydatia muelleri]
MLRYEVRWRSVIISYNVKNARFLFATSNDFDILYLRVEDIPSKGICLRALKTFIYCNPEQEVLDRLYLCDKKT